MPIRLGDRGPHVRQWRRVMNARFGGDTGAYAREAGVLPTDTDEFGPRAKHWQAIYERRTFQKIDGEVSDQDLAALGISPGPESNRLPWLFTVHGTGMADPMGPGLPADTARDVLDKYRWQPIGNYPAATFPMGSSINKGENELTLQINSKPGPINLAGYSQGAVVVCKVLKHKIMSPQGSLHHRLKDVGKVVLWGNPMRQENIAHFDHWIHPIAPPNTFGIMEDRLEGMESVPFEFRDYAHKGDMHAAISEGDRDEWKIMIQRILFKATDFYSGENSVVSQLRELSERPIQEGIAAARAAIDAMVFFANQSPHFYNRYPAVEFLRAS